MTKTTIWAALAATALFGCGDAGEANQKLDNLGERMGALEGKINIIEQWVGKLQKEATDEKGDQDALSSYSLNYQLEKIEKRLASIQDKLDRPTTFSARPTRPGRPPRPDPDTVYSVAIDDAPYRGARHARVTIVKAYEYA